MMGAGKSTVGKALAKHLSWGFVDTDALIEKQTGVRVPLLFELEGEAGFRRRETQVLSGLQGQTQMVVATGGGIVLSPENRTMLASLGTVIYLRATAQELYQRTRFDKNRPLLQGPNPSAVLENLLAQRTPLYEACANMVVETGRQPVSELIQDMCQQLQLNLKPGRTTSGLSKSRNPSQTKNARPKPEPKPASKPTLRTTSKSAKPAIAPKPENLKTTAPFEKKS
jgi:shikimate kinase